MVRVRMERYTFLFRRLHFLYARYPRHKIARPFGFMGPPYQCDDASDLHGPGLCLSSENVYL